MLSIFLPKLLFFRYNTPMHKTYLLIAFITGFVLMVFEMVAARLMSPVVGGSTYIWASIIGVIIAAMSLGYFVGGVVADKRGSRRDVVWALFGVALLILLTTYQYAWLFEVSSVWRVDVRLQATLVAMVLFAPTSFMLGAISPYLVKLQTKSLDEAGRSVASLSALNSLGGIVGTFIAGFFLFGWLGARESLAILIVLVVGSSWLLVPKEEWRLRVVGSFACVVLAGLSLISSEHVRSIAIDTTAAHYEVREWQEDQSKRIRGILSGTGGIQSGIRIDKPDELVFWYTQEMANIVEAVPHKENILVLGGGTFTLPRYLAKTYPTANIEVVEIDPGLLPIARQYFAYTDPSNITIHFDDARTFLNRTNTVYDIILIDVYNDSEVPFSLVTAEYSAALRKHTNSKTVVAVNMIASKQAGCTPLFSALDAPYRAALGGGKYLYRVADGLRVSNLIAAYNASEYLPESYQGYYFAEQLLYTDSFTPIERLHQACVDENSTTHI